MQAYDEKQDVRRLVERLEEIRKEQALSRSKLLRMADMSPNVLDHWVHRGTDLQVGSLSRVLQAMGYELEIRKKDDGNDD